ncbi:MAG: type II toxin-antitoxin system PemK/MazF family toxin [Erysipelotrichaceae bacterium]
MSDGQSKDKKIARLDNANSIYKDIINNCKNKKLAYLDMWEEFQSKSFYTENNQQEKIKYKKYARGTVVFVNFGTSIGTELSGNHFAIVLSKDDNPFSGKVTVLPLTSKEKKYNIPIEQDLIINIFTSLIMEVGRIVTLMDCIQEDIKGNKRITYMEKDMVDYIQSYICKSLNSSGGIDINMDELQHIMANHLESITNVINYYLRYNKNSYAMIDNITTISKHRINKPINRFDPISNIKISDGVLDNINKEIINKIAQK